MLVHCQILDKHCVHCRGHCFDLILMKLCQNDNVNMFISMKPRGSLRRGQGRVEC